jgi:uncharacterized alkaline shock family protein YloU
VHCEFEALVQVSVEVQFGMSVQAVQESATPLVKKKPLAQVEHWESVAEVQVSVAVQFGMSVQAVQFAVLPPSLKVPVAHAVQFGVPKPGAQTSHLSPCQPVLHFEQT